MPQLQRCNTSIMEMPEREGDKRTEEIGAVVMAGNFPYLKYVNSQIQEI